MKLKLARHTFPDDNEWVIVTENVPIGTEYEMIGYEQEITIYNVQTNKIRQVDCYLVRRLDDLNEGYIPCCVLEVIDEQHYEDTNR